MYCYSSCSMVIVITMLSFHGNVYQGFQWERAVPMSDSGIHSKKFCGQINFRFKTYLRPP